tara:strand:- start:1660 stop:2109 length:450 start_codon:yes stop_codon:yes gene_type:complete
MDELKQSVQLAVHEQKDPLLIYKFEAFELFKNMVKLLNREIISFLIKGSIPNYNNNIEEAKEQKKENYKTSKDQVLNSEELASKNKSIGSQAGYKKSGVVETIIRESPKIGRNEKVKIKNISSGENKILKFKQAEPLINKGEWVFVEKE